MLIIIASGHILIVFGIALYKPTITNLSNSEFPVVNL